MTIASFRLAFSYPIFLAKSALIALLPLGKCDIDSGHTMQLLTESKLIAEALCHTVSMAATTFIANLTSTHFLFAFGYHLAGQHHRYCFSCSHWLCSQHMPAHSHATLVNRYCLFTNTTLLEYATLFAVQFLNTLVVHTSFHLTMYRSNYKPTSVLGSASAEM